MRAVQIRAFGEPGIVLELADLPEPPAPAAGEVLIGVEHAPINMNDLYLIQGVYPVRPSLPSVVGNEGMGASVGHWQGRRPPEGRGSRAGASLHDQSGPAVWETFSDRWPSA